MKSKKIFFLIFLVSLLAFGNIVFLTNSKQDTTILQDDLTPNTQTLTIVTRHDTTIMEVYEDAFIASPLAQTLGVTSIDFRQATTDDGWKKLLEDPSRGVDLAWGGGPALFNTMDNWGLLKHIDNTTLLDYIRANVPDEIAGARMISNDSSDNIIWVANAISSFGFTINEEFLDDYGLPVPTTWEELASPTYYINPSVKAISMGDPPLTTSNTRIYQIILQAFGWEEGWSIITRMGGNAGIYPGSVDTRAAVVNGEVGIGMTIDFYGVIAKRENENTRYIIPEGKSIVNGDPIALGKHVDNLAAAEAFIQYLLSAEGNAVWMTEGLDRLPVNVDAFSTPLGLTRTDIYKLYNDTLENESIDFNETLSTANLDSTIYYFHNTITEVHDKLRQTWGEMVTQLREGDITEETFNDLVDDLGEVNMTLEESIEANEAFIADPILASELESQWRSFARSKYNGILEALGVKLGDFQLIPVLVSTVFVSVIAIIYRRKRK